MAGRGIVAVGRTGPGARHRRTGFVIPVAFILALAAVGVSATSAMASNGADTTHFTAAYENPLGGTWTCAGERIEKTAPKPFTKDSEDCTITDLSSFPPGTYVGHPFFFVNGEKHRWASDLDGQIARLVTIVVSNAGGGTGDVSIVAYY
jgi:hypothetical protein